MSLGRWSRKRYTQGMGRMKIINMDGINLVEVNITQTAVTKYIRIAKTKNKKTMKKSMYAVCANRAQYGPDDGARVKVRKSPKSVEFILWD